ncbi:hypothetical protein Y032_0569g88 [Ancylostoma ceylanicum]|nr:hypothetical protein Y032_0569g88 [Ancylostoma ceylanicum]
MWRHLSSISTYYSLDVIEKAVEAGLFTLVADGIHQMNPRSNRRARVNIEEGQLYTIHGVCEGEIEAPFLYAIALHKREQVHVTIYREMKKAIQLCSPQPATEPVLRIILDFEKKPLQTQLRLCSLVAPSRDVACI